MLLIFGKNSKFGLLISYQMYEYIKGTLAEISPTEVVIENNGVGYKVLISLNTFSRLVQGADVKLFIHHHLREDSELLFGFFDKEERFVFRNLIDVSGIGPNTARTMLSSMSPEEIRVAIIAGDVNKIKSIKGIGLKTAQRVLVDLKDKIGKSGGEDLSSQIFLQESSAERSEATTALVLLGFSKAAVERVVDSILKENPAVRLEDLIKLALKRL